MVALGVMSDRKYEDTKDMTRRTARIVSDELAAKGLELYHIKFEFGYSGDECILIDEIASGNMRCYKDGKYVQPLELSKMFFAED